MRHAGSRLAQADFPKLIGVEDESLGSSTEDREWVVGWQLFGSCRGHHPTILSCRCRNKFHTASLSTGFTHACRRERPECATVYVMRR